MKYESLSAIYYRNEEQYETTYRERFGSVCTVHLPVSIHGQPAFYMHLPSFSATIESIYQWNQLIDQLWDALPAKAQGRYYTKVMFSEMQHSNTIEGVHSSRKELQKAFDAIDSPKNVRFKGLVRNYHWFEEKQEFDISDSKALRDMYDHTLLPDIPASDTPDGVIFRKGSVDVRSATDKVIHRGITPEADLIAFMDAAIQYINESDFSLSAIAAFHYLFGYAHPFYDGNGRSVRLLSTLYLAQHLNVLIGLNISATIFSDRNAYYKAFDVCNERKNRGDMTPFISYFLAVIEKSAKSTYEMLKEALERFQYFLDMLASHPQLSEIEYAVLNLLIQVSLFSDNGIGIGGLQRNLKKSYQPVRDAISRLSNGGFPITTEKQGNQILYKLDLDLFEEAIKKIPD